MSDLCYNCSTCHMQSGPCLRDLVQCDICYNWGHQYNFCPRGVTTKDPNYRYWALCHNCDVWHLPNVCDKPFHKCQQCGHGGHLEFFCPVNPVDRTTYAREHYQRQANILHPTNHGVPPSFEGAISRGLITRMKLDAVHQAFSMLDNGWDPNQVVTFMAGPSGTLDPALTPDITPIRLAQQPVASLQPTQQIPAAAANPPHIPVQPRSHQMTQTDAIETDHGTYITMHQRFDQGHLAKSIKQARPMDTVAVPGTPTVTQSPLKAPASTPTLKNSSPTIQAAASKQKNTEFLGYTPTPTAPNNNDQQAVASIEVTEEPSKPAKIPKLKKAVKAERESTPTTKQGPRCAACIKAHRRCKHRIQTPTPQELSDLSQSAPGAADHNAPATSGATEVYVPAPATLPDRSFQLPGEQASESEIAGPKKVAPKRKR